MVGAAWTRTRQAALLVAVYAALTCVMTWPYVSYAHFGSASYRGDARLVIWTLAWDNHALLSGTPLFQSNIFHPAADSLRYNEHLFGVSLLTLPWAAAGASPVLAYNATWWLAFFLNGLAAFALLQRFVRAPCPAFIGSLAFACSFYVMLHAHGHLHLILLWPLPVSILLLERWLDDPRPRRLALWFAVVLLGALTSWYVAVMVVLVNVVSTAVLLLSGSDRSKREVAVLRGVAGWRPAGALVGAFVVLGACLYPFARHYVGLRSAPGETEAFSASLASYLIPPENTLAGGWWKAHVDARPGPIWGEQTLFAGWIALATAAVGVAALLRDRSLSRRAWVFPALAIAGFLLSLGPSPPLLGGRTLAPFAWMSALPGFEGMRAPARFAAVAMLGISGLSAIGAAALARTCMPRRPEVLLALVPLMLAEWFVVGFPGGPPVPHPVPGVYRTPEVRSATAIASLPEYTGLPEWFNGADYLYYSTAHWRPIVNGFGRSEPTDHAAIVAGLRDFPARAGELRRIGVQYVVVHAGRFSDRAATLLAAARASAGCRLVRAIDSDYLFEMLETPPGAPSEDAARRRDR
jgi:hypothetical protein